MITAPVYRCAAFAAIISAFIFSCGCAKTTIGPSSSSKRIPGVLRIASPPADNLNILVSGGGTSVYLGFLWGAWLYVQDAHGQQSPELATDIPSLQNGGISKDGLTITYHLRRGVVWQDGVPFDARDVIFTWRQIMNPKNNVTSRTGYDKIASMSAPDPYTLHVRLKEPYAPAVATFFAPGEVPICILPRHLLGRLSDLNRARYNDMPVGTGPFEITHYDRSSEVTLQANPRYWRGRPKLNTIHYVLVADPNTRSVMMRSGELDVDYETASYANQLRDAPDVRLVHEPAYLEWFIALNERHAPLDDPRIRHAIAMGVDRRHYLNNFLHGYGSIAESDQPPFLWSFDPQVRSPKYDPASAQRLLDAAGWHVGAHGIRERAGQRLSLTYVYATDQADAAHYAPVFQNEMRRIGIDITIKPFPYNLYYAEASAGGILNSGKYDVAFTGWVGGLDPDDAALWMCDQLPPQGYNESFSCDPRIDAQERIALHSYDRDTRKAAYWRIQELLAEDQPVVFLVWSDYIYSIRSELRGFYPTATYSNVWNWQI